MTNTHPLQSPGAFRQARHQLGLTGEALGAALHVDGRTIRRWEAGNRAIPWATAFVLGLWLDPECPEQFKPGRDEIL